jgi:cyclohexa-1,5-dienecarbonyl-CoA hydratase
MGFNFITFDRTDKVATLTINRPPYNVLDIPTMKEMNEALAEARKMDGISALVLTAAGSKAFSSGVDVKDHTPDKMDEMIRVFHQIFRTLVSFDIPTVAAVNGVALGGGCEVASFCDLVVASEHSKFGQPEIMVGVYPSMAVAWFSKIMGMKRAFELLLTGKTISAETACDYGLVNQVFPDEEYEQGLETFLADLTGKSSAVLKWCKRAIKSGLDVPFEKGLSASEVIYQYALMGTKDAGEGLKAFLEKRNPVWQEK